MNENRFMDLPMVSNYLHVSRSLIYKMVMKNKIPYRKIGTRTLFVPEEIDNWVLNNGRMEDELPTLPNL